MNVLLTGISGNLGHEVALDLNRRGINIIPIVRPGKKDIPLANQIKLEQVITNDLTQDEKITISTPVDCIVHCAGIVHFRDAGNTNEKMMKTLIRLANRLKIPIYFVSTAFVYRPLGIKLIFNNSYEHDKFRAEHALISSGIVHAIFRPSVLGGNSETGQIQNFSGFYTIVKELLLAVNNSRTKGQKLRFPKLPGKSDIVPVDQAARHMGDVIQNGKFDLEYITNPNPPKSSWVFKKTLDFFDLSGDVDILGCSFEAYGKLDLSEEEKRLYNFCRHFNPYWSIAYRFPQTICNENLIDHEYLVKTLSYFANSKNINYDRRTN